MTVVVFIPQLKSLVRQMANRERKKTKSLIIKVDTTDYSLMQRNGAKETKNPKQISQILHQ